MQSALIEEIYCKSSVTARASPPPVKPLISLAHEDLLTSSFARSPYLITLILNCRPSLQKQKTLIRGVRFRLPFHQTWGVRFPWFCDLSRAIETVRQRFRRSGGDADWIVRVISFEDVLLPLKVLTEITAGRS